MSRARDVSIDETRGQEAPLADELRLVEQYLEIQRIRFADRLSIDIDADDESDSSPLQIADTAESPDDFAQRRELAAAIQVGLTMLPDEQRIVLILSDIQGLPYEEIAQITNSNLGTVKSRLSRGRARLREVLKAGELLPTRYRHESE